MGRADADLVKMIFVDSFIGAVAYRLQRTHALQVLESYILHASRDTDTILCSTSSAILMLHQQ